MSRLKWFVLLAFALAFVASTPPLPAAAQEPPSETELAQQLVERWAPVYYMREQQRACDRNGQAWDPARVELVIGGDPAIFLRGIDGPDVAAPTEGDIAGLDEPAHLDFPGNPRRPGCQFEHDYLRLSEGTEPAVYAAIRREEGREGFAIQYWAFYYFNDWNNTHEGDWEMVTLVFDVETFEEALEAGPSYAAYAEHGSGERQPWGSNRIVMEDGRPVVFVSAGSNASYFQPDVFFGVGEDGSGFGCDIATGPHRTVDPDILLIGDPAETPPWLTFSGRWGELVAREFNGPTGPQMKRAWREPISWAEDRRTGTVTLPAASLFGINSVSNFCDVVAAGSRLLRAFLYLPVLVGGSLFVVFGVLAVSGLVVLNDTRKSSLVGQRGEPFLRQRRTLGQVIRAAITIYLREPWLFLGISATFIPVELVFTIIHDWIVGVPPFENLAWLLSEGEFSEILISLLAGGLASIAVFILVLTCALSAIAQLDSGGRATVRSAYAAGFARLGDVAGARVRTLVVAAVLSLSLVGLPVAVWLTVRWYFIEHGAVFDQGTWWTAPAKSARVVTGRFFRALRYILVFAVFGAIAGPLLGMVLLLLTDLDGALINTIAGIFHAFMLPLTALGTALAYADLSIRAEEECATGGEPPAKPKTPLGRAWRWAGTRIQDIASRYEGGRRPG